MDQACVTLSKKYLPNSTGKRFSAMFLSKSFTVLCLAFRLTIPFELIFVGDIDVGQDSLFRMWIVQHHRLKTVFCPLDCHCTFVKYQLTA